MVPAQAVPSSHRYATPVRHLHRGRNSTIAPLLLHGDVHGARAPWGGHRGVSVTEFVFGGFAGA